MVPGEIKPLSMLWYKKLHHTDR